MFGYNKYKERIALEKAYKEYNKICSDTQTIKNKVKEINKSNLEQDAKDSLIEILEAQHAVVLEDARLYGFTMSKFFENDEEPIKKLIPIGAKVKEFIKVSYACPNIIYFSAIKKQTSNNAQLLEDTALQILAEDIVSDTKIETINKLRINKKIKTKLTKFHRDNITTRKRDLDCLVEGLEISSIQENYELPYLKELYYKKYTEGGYADTSALFGGVVSQLHNDSFYKKPIAINTLPIFLGWRNTKIDVMDDELQSKIHNDERFFIVNKG